MWYVLPQKLSSNIGVASASEGFVGLMILRNPKVAEALSFLQIAVSASLIFFLQFDH